MEKFTDNRKLRVVISPMVASKLCNMGYPIVKIKPKKSSSGKVSSETVFLFEETEQFDKDLNELLKETKTNLLEDL